MVLRAVGVSDEPGGLSLLRAVRFNNDEGVARGPRDASGVLTDLVDKKVGAGLRDFGHDEVGLTSVANVRLGAIVGIGKCL